MMIRLDKFLTETGSLTRSQAKEAAKKGRILVNGEAEKKTDRKIDPEKDEIVLDGKRISYAAYEYYMLNKPKGVVSATEDKKYPTVVQLIQDRKRTDLFPAGRLDIDTEGLLLITNDGELTHNLLSPKKHVDKVYLAEFEGVFPEDGKEQFQAGLILEDGVKTMPSHIIVNGNQARLTIKEGKFHQVKRMFQAVGCQVTYLKRLSMGSLTLDENLKPGEYRPLTNEEIESLKQQ
ncbi:pseudouridine synthase [Lachnoclostridium edouardi]|uniref:pseudouridine synthase n=1 Tax=Lachnoclostridium edouardi TaxID=1926283 RepID=UPI000C79D1F4|nr:pseudouridine synthase [Lachnoclostridium edouardi]